MFWFIMYMNKSVKSTHHEHVCFQGVNSVALFIFQKLILLQIWNSYIVFTVILTNCERTHNN